MELATDVIFVVLSPVNNDLFVYIFATCVGCEITYVGNTELNNVLVLKLPALSTSLTKKPGCSE